MSEAFDLLVAGGTLLDPATGTSTLADVGVTGGRIAAIAPGLPRHDARQIVEAVGCYVTPGLIDLHVHAYAGVNPFGMDVDPVCIGGGVTTAVDAGSAGPVNFAGFRRFVQEVATTRLLAFVALAQHGVLKAPGELEDLRFADSDGAARTVLDHPSIAVGIKVRLHRQAVGDHGREALRLALRAGEACRSPVMVHVGNTGIPLEEIVETLRAGDIVTHCYTPQSPSIVDDRGHLRPAVLEAHERGVRFDVGHAANHFDFDLARRAIAGGLAPDVISTDLHGRLTPDNVVVDLPTTMTKLLALGLPLERVIAGSTSGAAAAIGWGDRIGSLQAGRTADLAVLALVDGLVQLRDSVGGVLVADRQIVARATIRAGVLVSLPARRS